MNTRMKAKVNQKAKHNIKERTAPMKTAVVVTFAFLSASISGTAENRCIAEVHINAAKRGRIEGIKRWS